MGSYLMLLLLQAAPTPLTRLKWWRVVMDEAQMVERPSHAAAMARQLEATHRWAFFQKAWSFQGCVGVHKHGTEPVVL